MSKSFEDHHILKDLSFDVANGEFLVIVGASGTGKSSLLNIIAGLLDADKGIVKVDGEEIIGPKLRLVPGYEEIQLVHQGFKLHPFMTVEENVRRSLLAYVEDYQEERLTRLLGLSELQSMRHRLPTEISGGQQQKLAISTALANEPDILLLDEPFSNLDPFSKHRFLVEIKEMTREMSATVIFVTHDTRDALVVADRLMVLEDGEIVQTGSPEEIYRAPKSKFIADFFSDVNYMKRSVFADLWPKIKLSKAEEIGVRPEDVHIQLSGSEANAEIIQVTFQGPEYHYLIAIDGQEAKWSGTAKSYFRMNERVAILPDEKRLMSF